jgi:hypothetical protein
MSITGIKAVQPTREIGILDQPRSDQDVLLAPRLPDPVDVPVRGGPDDSVQDTTPNPRLDAAGNILAGEKDRLRTLAEGGDKAALAVLQASDQAEAAGVPFSTFALPLARAGIDIAAQFLPQGSQAQQIATGARRIGDVLGVPQASSNPTVAVYTNRAINAVNTVRNVRGLLRGF